jgi:hypothetical protein
MTTKLTDAKSEYGSEDVHRLVGGAEHVGETCEPGCYQGRVVHPKSIDPIVIGKESGNNPTDCVRYS